MHFCGYAGVLLSLAGVALSALNYKPISGFTKNRNHFYEHEKTIARSENSKIPSIGGDNIRVAHFDTHWHGLSIEEYVQVANEIKADVLVARGVPEKQGNSYVVRERLANHGFDRSSVIHEPMASLTSGMLVGVRNGITVSSSSPIIVERRIAAIEVTLNLTPTEKMLLVVLMLDAFDSETRLRQLATIQSRLSSYERQSPKYMILGGFHNAISHSSQEMRAINNPTGIISNAFTVLGRPSPSYTSWLGVFSDTALVSHPLKPVLRGINVWHTDRADCLPIVIDLAVSRLGGGGGRLMTAGPEESRYEGIRDRVFSWNWRVLACGFGTTAVILLVAIAFISYYRRDRSEKGRKIQQGGAGTFSDNDLKMARTHPSMEQGQHHGEKDEKQ
ncbi:hypothetical protein PSACC_00739 [Paramicrosporidium saccamoebae]|uniref:Endonuclease/exonuclease/phosphatase domain-containing protein n=1 Tax=Paramicrosporidium saccamoebae TaxID=1246581 RepID=A0A2H9TP74_9FUNG|nr:hypothetical protein PSACC_00739 [Paramicrosporidium saccamoebae]